MQIKDKVALVTGSAHRVGKAIALGLAREGAHIIVHYGGAASAARDTVLELFHYECPQGREPRPDALQSDLGLIHIGFMVEDFHGTYQSLVDRGISFLGEPVEIRPGVWVAYFRGVEYEVCEIREIQAQPAAPYLN